MRSPQTFSPATGLLVSVLLAGSAIAGDMDLAKLQESMQAMQKQLVEQQKLLDAQKQETARLKLELEKVQSDADEVTPTDMKSNLVPDAVRSLGRNGMVTFGGALKTEYRFLRGSDPVNVSLDNTNAGWSVSSADFAINVATTRDTRAFIKLESGVLSEAYYEMANINATPWSLRAGLMTAPFGMAYAGVITTEPYTYGNGPTGMDSSYFRELDLSHDDSSLNKNFGSSTVELPGWIGQRERAPGLYGSWHWDELVTVEGMFFQETNKDRERSWVQRSYPGYSAWSVYRGDGNPDDNGFQSFALKTTVRPASALMLEASLLNRHNDAKGQTRYTNPVTGAAYDRNGNLIATSGGLAGLSTDPVTAALRNRSEDATDSTTALSLGFTYDLNPAFKLYGEYLYNWNMDYYTSGQANVFSTGFDYTGIQRLTLSLVAEAAFQDLPVTPIWIGSGSIGRGSANGLALIDEINLYRLMFGAKYTLDNGVFFGAELGLEWMDRLGRDEHDDSRFLQMIGLNTGFNF